MALTRAEVLRKMLHFVSGTILPLAILYIPLLANEWDPQARIMPAWAWAPLILLLGLLGLGGVDVLRMRMPQLHHHFGRWFGPFLRPEESRKMTGATYINASALLCSIVLRDHPHIACMALATFIWGDAFAALVGLSIGRIRIGKKSLEGSLACLSLCLVMYLFIFPFVPRLLDAYDGRMPIAIAVTGSVCVTVLELIPMRIGKTVINDNLVVPVITGLVLWGLGSFI